MTVLSVRHITSYRYGRPVGFGEHRAMFRPRDSYDQRLLSSTLVIRPHPARLRWMHDVFGNCVAIADFEGRAEELVFESHIRVEHTPQNAPDFEIEDRARSYPFAYDEQDLPDLGRLTEPHYPDPTVARFARRFLRPGGKTDTARLLMTLTYGIKESFAYQRRTAPGTQTPAETLALRRGTCRDFALLMIEAVRSLGFAARFVTGYIYVPDRDGDTNLGGGSTHAWCQVYVPGAGWIEFDPTNGIIGNRDLIRVAVARDPAQAIPLSGSYIGLATDSIGMDVQVNVTTPAQRPEPAARLRVKG